MEGDDAWAKSSAGWWAELVEEGQCSVCWGRSRLDRAFFYGAAHLCEGILSSGHSITGMPLEEQPYISRMQRFVGRSASFAGRLTP